MTDEPTRTAAEHEPTVRAAIASQLADGKGPSIEKADQR